MANDINIIPLIDNSTCFPLGDSIILDIVADKYLLFAEGSSKSTKLPSLTIISSSF